MRTIDEVKAHCRFVGEGIEKMVADGEDLGARFEGTQIIRFKVDKDGNDVKVVGGEMEGDDTPRSTFVAESCSLQAVECMVADISRASIQ